ncbi:nuclear transport factor 2 family protein [Companilactobacillus jidongensis]|uniref:nuclear transport factor 2 family protein n=1 Tax=Companilactobacillus jidongensis TaxID=2486006 RepID=UPI000F78C57C|nr:nuclear transport factor 2 family protein [Companilactobacillus jidongensis]
MMNKIMDRNKETIKKYFELSDFATDDDQAVNDIIDLFSDNVAIRSGCNVTATNKEEVAAFFRTFFNRNKKLKHIFKTQNIENYYQTEWSVAGLKSDGAIFALHGFDYYRFDEDGKICSLLIEIV